MKIIAHRCGTDRFPQLTIASAKHSLNCGAAYVELDIRFTKDGYPVILHDDNTKFLFGVDYKVNEQTLNEFLSLRHQNDVAFPTHSLEHILRSGIRNILFHVKEGGANLYEIFALCNKYDCLNSVVFGLQSIEDTKLVKEYNTNIKILAFMPSVEDSKRFAETGADYIRVWESWLTNQTVSCVKQTGKEIWVMAGGTNSYSVGYTNPDNIRHWKEMGVDGVLIDEVEQFFNQN